MCLKHYANPENYFLKEKPSEQQTILTKALNTPIPV